MINKIIVVKNGRYIKEWEFFLDGERTTPQDVAESLGYTMAHLRSEINKAENPSFWLRMQYAKKALGLPREAKPYVHNGAVMFSGIVQNLTGASIAVSCDRCREFAKHGYTKKLFKKARAMKPYKYVPREPRVDKKELAGRKRAEDIKIGSYEREHLL